jgi:hypothetical protein
MDKRFTSNPLPDPSVEPGSGTTENSKPSHKTQHMRKINKTKILKTATELKKKELVQRKWSYSYLSAMESESLKEADACEEQERKVKEQVEVADLKRLFAHLLDDYFHGYLVCRAILLMQQNHSLSPCKTRDLCLTTLEFCQET